ncbi:hypothetical protein Q3G72_027708 [Acer saccharum]|nr:hypothetical protein Q3G72_027708 [Acer saccharum]
MYLAGPGTQLTRAGIPRTLLSGISNHCEAADLKVFEMKYLNPLSLFIEVLKTKSFESKSLLGLQLTEKYVDLAVSDSDNKVAVPLSSLNRQRIDFYLMADKLQILISKHNLMGIVVGNPSRRTLEKLNCVANKAFFDELCKTGKFEGLKYTYWDDLISSKHMEFQLKHNLEFMIEHLNLPQDKSKEIIDRCIAAHMLQGYLDCSNMVTTISSECFC